MKLINQLFKQPAKKPFQHYAASNETDSLKDLYYAN